MTNNDSTGTKEPLKPKLILLDIYETILDMKAIEKRVNVLMDSKRAYTIWFELFMQYCFVDNCTVQFHNFSSIAEATLKMTSQMLRKQINADEINGILELMKHLPIKENVQKGLSELHKLNFRVAALTNSPEAVVTSRMEKTGLFLFLSKCSALSTPENINRHFLYINGLPKN